MSSLVIGPFKVNTISGGVINLGDAFYIAPSNSEKSISGSGGGGIGDFQVITNGTSVTKGVDTDALDQPTDIS